MHALITEIVLPAGLFLLNLGLGLSLSPDDFKRVLSARKPALVGLISILVVIPGLGFLVAHLFPVSPEIAVGIVLVATCPGGMFSNLMSDYAKGNLALSVTLTAVGSTLYIFTVPAWADLAVSQFMRGDTTIGLPFLQTLAPLLIFVLLPISIGMIVRARAETWALKYMGAVKNVAALSVVVIMIYVAVTQESETVANLHIIAAAVAVLNIASVAAAALFSVLFRLDGKDTVSVLMEHAVRQEGTGIYIAATLIGSPTMALPLLLNSGVGMLIALTLLLISRWRRGEFAKSRGAQSIG